MRGVCAIPGGAVTAGDAASAGDTGTGRSSHGFGPAWSVVGLEMSMRRTGGVARDATFGAMLE